MCNGLLYCCVLSSASVIDEGDNVQLLQEVNVQNAAAWTSLAQQPENAADKADEGANAQEDELWKEFASREQQQQQVVGVFVPLHVTVVVAIDDTFVWLHHRPPSQAQAKQDAEAAQQKQREEELKAAREAAERKRAQEQAEKEATAREEAARIEALKAKEAAQLEELAAPKGEPMEEDQANLAVQGANPLGLQMVEQSDDESDSEESG